MEKVFETNLVKKDLRKVKLKFAICYPEPYRVGMSCLAIHTIYSLLNSAEDIACERAFLPSDSLSATQTLESNVPLRKMDAIGFSLQYEVDYVNALTMLINSQIPLLSKDRGNQDPLVIAGGPCATGNPEPMSDFVDIFVIGEAESVLPKLLDRIEETRRPRSHLSELSDLDGLYIPSSDQDSVSRAWVSDLDAAPHPISQVIPHAMHKRRASPVFGETFLAEVTRGCCHGCRFCYLGYIGRPYRERKIGTMEEIIEQGVSHTGVSKVTLIGSGLSDYSHLVDICGWIVDQRGLALSVSSLRADSASTELLKVLARGGERTLTIAPETGSEALRRSLNKRITDDDITCAAENALEAGIRNLKLYFMVGLPGETEQDIQDMTSLVKQIAKLGYGTRSIRLSIAPFIPKPHTPFQWFQQSPVADLQGKLKKIRSYLGTYSKVDVETLDLRWARIEALLSTGDRSMGNVLKSVAEVGGTLGSWRRAIASSGAIPTLSESSRLPTGTLPWDKIDVGISKEMLKVEKDRAAIREESAPCSITGSKCGVC